MKTSTLMSIVLLATAPMAHAQIKLPKYVDFLINAVTDPSFENPDAHAWDNSRSTWYDSAYNTASEFPYGGAGKYLPHIGSYCYDFWAHTVNPTQSDFVRVSQMLSAPVEVSKLTDASVWVEGRNRTLYVRIAYEGGTFGTAQLTLPNTDNGYVRWDIKPYLAAGKRITGIEFSTWAICDSTDPNQYPNGWVFIDDVSLTRIVRTYL